MATRFDDDVSEFDDPMIEGPQPAPTLVSGKLIVCVIAALGLVGAGAAWLHHFDQKRIPREFWGFESPRIFQEAQKVTAVLVKPEEITAEPKPQWYPELYLIDGVRYTVVETIDVTNRDDLQKVRERLNDPAGLDMRKKNWLAPEWRFGLIFVNDDEDTGATYTASIIFDADCRLGRPQTVEKATSTAPMQPELMAFFDAVFPQAKDMPRQATPTNSFTEPLVPGSAQPPTTQPSGDVATQPPQNGTGGAGATDVPSSMGPSVFNNRGPVVVPNAGLPPALGGLPQLQQNFSLPNSNPGPLNNSPAFDLPGGPLNTTPGPNPLNLDMPRGVTVPQISPENLQGVGT